MTTKKSPAPWQVRKIAQAVIAVAVAALGYFGVLSEIQSDQILEKAPQIIAVLLGTIGPAWASAHTNAGSDSTLTAADIPSAPAIAAAVAEHLQGEPGKHAAVPESPATSVAGYYEGR
jgi:hypothetical protein